MNQPYNPNQQWQGNPGQVPQQKWWEQPQQQQYAPQQQYQQPAAPAPVQQNGAGLMVQGRIVWISGKSIFEGKPVTDYNSGAVILDEVGQPIIEYGFGLAVLKVDPRSGQFTPDYLALKAALEKEAFSLYPQGVPRDFAFKVKDGDTDVDDKGVPYSKREVYVNHYVLSCTTRIAPKFFKWMDGNNVVVNTGIKNGDYVNVQLNLKAHPPIGKGKAGIYTNPTAVQFITAGKEIINSPSGDQMFGMQAPAFNGPVEAPQAPTMPGQGMPQGGVMGPGAPMPGNYGQPAQPQQQQYAPQQQAYNPPPAQHDPHYGVLPPQHQPAPQQGNGYAPQVTPQYGQMPPGNPTNGYPQGGPGPGVQNPAYPSNGQMPPYPGQR